jgi:tetratricopeptide (TPR) repeat protein
MSRSDSLQFLKMSLHDPSLLGDTIAAERLLDILAHLPLAMKQAAAFINENTTSVSQYLEICESSEDQFVELLSRDFEDKGRYKSTTAVKNPIALTWLVSFRQILTHDPLAVEYLFFMSCVAQQDIPDSLLLEAPKLKRTDAIGMLKAYGFIAFRVEQLSYDIHRLVQIMVRSWLKQKRELEWWRGKTLQRLAKVFPFPKHENRDMWTLYLPHTNYVLGFQKYSEKFVDFHWRLIFCVGVCFQITGKYDRAEISYRQTLELTVKVLGIDHPSTLSTMNNLASVLNKQGKHDEAEKIHRQTIELTEKVLSIDHPSTLSSMNNLALVLDNQGKYDEAEKIHRQTIEVREKVLGIDHPSTLDCMNNLALVLDNLGKYDEAEKIHRQTIELKEKVLGIDHPSTLDSMNNLALVLNNQCKYDDAEKIHRHTIELKEKVLGIDHPSTLSSMNNLALVLNNQGKYDEAEKIHRQTIELREMVLGIDHPSTLRSLNNLASVLKSKAKYNKQIK